MKLQEKQWRFALRIAIASLPDQKEIVIPNFFAIRRRNEESLINKPNAL
jgi:hypothetical protein